MENVNLEIDKIRRNELRHLHSATHILNNCSKQILGPSVWQNGSNLKNDYGTLDITYFKNISFEELKKIEKLVNKIIFENREIEITTLKRDEAEKEYGFEIYQGGAIPQTKLRIIKINNSDIEACGGIHCKRTGEIGFFKIENCQKIQDGLYRLKFRVGDYAINLINEKEKILENLLKNYQINQNDIEKTFEKFFNSTKELTKKNDKIKNSVKKLIVENIISKNLKTYEILEELDLKELCEIFEKINKTEFSLDSEKFFLTNEKNIEEEKFKKKITKNNYNVYIK
jgi:alanyl-tRNA synthetase